MTGFMYLRSLAKYRLVDVPPETINEIGQLLAEYDAQRAAIERVRALCDETLRLCRQAGVPESAAHLSPQTVLRALGGEPR